jgi:hypothetical protein
VSAILKALKKLEQETVGNAGVPLNGSVKGRPRKQPGKRPGSLVVPGLIAFTLCIFVGIGILIYTQNTSVFKSTSPESPVVPIKDENAVLPEKIPVEKIPSQSRPSEIDTRKPVKPADPFAPIMPEPGMADENSVLIEDNLEPDTFHSTVSAAESSVPAMPAVVENEFIRKPVAKKTEPPVAVIEDPTVELQAISWSADPDKRLAIINGKICREKDRVAGYVIQSINSDDVIVSKGSEKGKIVFKIR